MADKSLLPMHVRIKLVDAVLEFMARCGSTAAEIKESFDASLAAYRRRQMGITARSDDTLCIRKQNVPAQLLRIWYRDSRYIDQEATPRPLPLTRGPGSLRAIIKRIDSSADASSILRGMKKVGQIRRTSDGRYLPTSESAIVDQLHPLMGEHVTKLINRLVCTVNRNTDPSGQSLSLIDRHAYTSDMNPKEREAFAEFSRAQGMACLQSIDDWLERRRVSRTAASIPRGVREAGVAAGVYLFAYLGDDEAEKMFSANRRSKSKAGLPRSKKSTPSRAARA